MNRAALVFGCGILLLCSSMAKGAGTSASPPRSLKEAIQFAQAARLAIPIAQSATQQANARLLQARSRFYPTIDLNGTVSNTRNYDSYTGVVASAYVPAIGQVSVTQKNTIPRYQIEPSISVNYDLYSGGKDTARLNRSRFELQSSETEESIASRDVTYQVVSAYLRLEKTYYQYQRAAVHVDHGQFRAQLAARKLQEGRLSQIDASAEKMQLENYKDELDNCHADLDAQLAEYAVALGLAPNASGLESKIMPQFNQDVDADINLAMKYANPGLENQKVDLDLQADREEIKVQSAANRPSVKLFLQYHGVGRDVSSVDAALQNFHKQYWVGGVQFSYNLFDGYLAQQKVSESVAKAEQLHLEQERQLKNLSLSKSQSELALRKATRQVKLATDRLELARARQVVAEAKLNAGNETAISLDEAKSHVLEAMKDVQIAKVDWALAKLNLLFPNSVNKDE